ncbi:alpha/beta hydrolase [Patescibacteria group bacterium]|nr:alpha/beta hydrolase [Patescibacteria group bacterium]
MECVINGLKINYMIMGEGKPLLILHGWGSKKERWRTVAKLLSGRGFQVIVPDLPGFGESDNPDGVWGFDDYANLVDSFISSLDIRHFRLLGHSFGGNVAIKYSLKHPDKVSKLFLVGAACIRRETVKKKGIYGISKTFKFLSFVPYLKKAFYRIIKSDYSHSRGIMKEVYLNIIKKDLTDILGNVNVPTLIIWGEKDDITPLKNAHTIKINIKNSQLEIIPRIGHNLHSECPGFLADIIAKQ